MADNRDEEVGVEYDRLVQVLVPLKDDDWRDIDHLMSLGVSNRTHATWLSEIPNLLQPFMEFAEATSLIVAIVNWDEMADADEFADHPDLRKRVRRLQTRYGRALRRGVSRSVRGDNEWVSLDVSGYTGRFVDPTIRIEIDLEREARLEIETTSAGFARLIRSLAHEGIEIVPTWTALDSDAQEVRDILDEAVVELHALREAVESALDAGDEVSRS